MRLHSELGLNAGFIAQDIAAAVQLDHPRAHNALAEVFVRRADQHLLHTVVLGCFIGGRSQRVIGLKVDLRPHLHAHGFQRLLKHRKLREQLRRHAFAGLVSGIQIVAERLHDMIGGHAQVGCALLDHGQDGGQDAAHCADFLAIHIRRSGHGEKVPEQFIRPINQVDIHAAPISFLRRCYTSQAA